jgi:hypothetical protein
MKKFLLFAAALMTGSAVYADTETYSACDEAGNMVSVFPVGEITETSSVVTFGTPNLDVVAVGGATPKTVAADGSVTEWNAITWSPKAQNLQDNVDGLDPNNFYYVLGTGNPYVEMGYEEIMRDGEATGEYRATYVLYGPQDEVVGDKTYKNQMPVSGLYYKFTPKANGTVKVQVWSNKGNRNTLVVEESSKQPVAYTAEGYINGQNEQKEATINGEAVTYNAKKYLSAAEVQEIHDAAKVVDGVDTAPYVIGAGNQAFWGFITFAVEAGKTYWLFQDSSQIGFGGYEFTTEGQGGGEEPVVNYDYYTLTFPEYADSFADREFSINITNGNDKYAVDSNSQYFGDETTYEQFTTRLKTGGKSGSNSFITVNIPAAGKLQVMARSASSSSVRALVVSQNDAEIYNQLLDDGSAITVSINDKDTKVFKVHETDVQAGTATITYPDGAINFYCIRLAVPQGSEGIDAIVNDVVNSNVIYNLRGQRVNEMTPGQIYIVNGKKVIR